MLVLLCKSKKKNDSFQMKSQLFFASPFLFGRHSEACTGSIAGSNKSFSADEGHVSRFLLVLGSPARSTKVPEPAMPRRAGCRIEEMGEICIFLIRFRPNYLFLSTLLRIFATPFCLSQLTNKKE